MNKGKGSILTKIITGIMPGGGRYRDNTNVNSSDNSEETVLPSDITLSPLLTERFTSLWTRMQRSTQKQRLIIQITSACGKEGRTTMVFLAGRTLASSNQGDFVLIDSDVYHPDLHSLLEVKMTPGLLDLFRGKATLEEVIKPTRFPHLYLLSLGSSLPINQAQILISQNIGALLEELRDTYDCILIDSPPINLSSLGEINGTYSDGTILVVRANFSRREVIQTAIKALEGEGVVISGVVLNRRKFAIPEFIYRRMK